MDDLSDDLKSHARAVCSTVDLTKMENNRNSPPTQPICVIFDFDETITEEDTIELLAKAACKINHQHHDWPCPDWQVLYYDYEDDLDDFDKFYPWSHNVRTHAQLELKYLERRNIVEDESCKRVSESKLFKNFTPQQIREAAELYLETGELELRNGLRELVDAVQARKDSKIGIVSVNWSKEFIWDVMDISGFGKIPTMANMIDPTNGSIEGTDGYITPSQRLPLGKDDVIARMRGPADKLGAMNALVRSGLNADNHGFEGTHHTTVYIGDSMTDLECLLSVDVPIIIIKNSHLMEDLIWMRIFPIHISAYERHKPFPTGWPQPLGDSNKEMYWAQDFSEIAKSELFLSKPEMEALVYKDTGIPWKKYFWDTWKDYYGILLDGNDNCCEAYKGACVYTRHQVRESRQADNKSLESVEGSNAATKKAKTAHGETFESMSEAQKEAQLHEQGKKLQDGLKEVEMLKEREQLQKSELEERRQALQNLQDFAEQGRAEGTISKQNMAQLKISEAEQTKGNNSGSSASSYESVSDSDDIWQPMSVKGETSASGRACSPAITSPSSHKKQSVAEPTPEESNLVKVMAEQSNVPEVSSESGAGSEKREDVMWRAQNAHTGDKKNEKIGKITED